MDVNSFIERLEHIVHTHLEHLRTTGVYSGPVLERANVVQTELATIKDRLMAQDLTPTQATLRVCETMTRWSQSCQ